MSKIEELKQAVTKLGNDVMELDKAVCELSNWEDYDLTRRDGSRAQDERHESVTLRKTSLLS